jgi:hypothetical protein
MDLTHEIRSSQSLDDLIWSQDLHHHNLREVSGFSLVFAYIQFWSPICNAMGEEVKNDDPIDCASRVVCTRRRWLGIFSLARVESAGRLTWSAS